MPCIAYKELELTYPAQACRPPGACISAELQIMLIAQTHSHLHVYSEVKITTANVYTKFDSHSSGISVPGPVEK